ncbi:MAG TPA: RNase H family protein [Oculatellaceae cyanobacterium]
MRLENVNAYERGPVFDGRDRLRHMLNGKKRLGSNEMVWVTRRELRLDDTKEEFLVRVQTLISDPHHNGGDPKRITHVRAWWYPKFNGTKKDLMIGCPSYVRNANVDPDRLYIEPQELKRVYRLLAGTNGQEEIRHGLKRQWDWTDGDDAHMFPEDPTLDQLPGIGFEWDISIEEFEFRLAKVIPAHHKLSKKLLAANKYKPITLETVELQQVETDIIRPQETQAHSDKRTLRQVMQDPTVQHVELWTDGSSKNITHDDEDGKRRKKNETRLGSGIRAVKDGDRENYLDLAWRIEGVGSIMGAELAPLAKVLKWAHESKRITVYMDSQAGIDAYQKAAAQQYTEREIVNSKDRTVLYMIRQAILKKPSLANNVRLIKVVSHTGDWGNEAADSLAELGALDDEATSFHRIREGLEFRLINLETNKPMYGNIRKQLKQIQQAKHCEALQACSAQGEFARTWAKETTPRKSGAHELMLSNKRQTNMVFAIQQQRAKWKIPAQGNEDSDKYICKVCKRETSNADHKLACMAGVQRMGLAELKLEFARVEKPCESEIHPNLQTTVRTRGDHCVIGSARFSIESVTVLSHGYWTVADVKADRQQGFKTAMTREYAKAMAATGTLEPVDETAARTNRQTFRAEHQRVTPALIMRELTQIGIDTELGSPVLAASRWMDLHYTDDEAHTKFGFHTGIYTHTLEGGTCRNLIGLNSEAVKWCSHVGKAMKSLRTNWQNGRHVALMTDRKANRNHITSNGGKIMMSWKPRCFRKATMKNQGDGAEAEGVVLAMWETEFLKQKWYIPIAKWRNIVRASLREHCGAPQIEISTGWAEFEKGIQITESDEEGTEYSSAHWSYLLWLELKALADTKACVFWSAHIPTLKNAPKPERTQMPANMHEIQKISIRPVGETEECKKHIQLIKRDENKDARQQVKEERKQIKKSMQNWYASREKQIYNTLVRIMDLHKHMGDARKSAEIETVQQSGPRPRNQTHTPTSRGNELEITHVSTEEPEAHETTQQAPTSRNKRKRPDTQEQELDSQPNLAHDSLPQADLDDPAHATPNANTSIEHEPVSAQTPRKTKRQNTSSAPRPHPGNPRNKRKTPDTLGQVLEPSHTPSGPVRNGMQDSPANSHPTSPSTLSHEHPPLLTYPGSNAWLS